MELNLPRGYLSHTQIDAWKKSKKDYRKRYYDGTPFYITPEIEFGKIVGGQYEALHGDVPVTLMHPIIGSIPRGTHPEYELRCEVRGIPVVGFIDSFDETCSRVIELKTGKTPWTQSRVDRHEQLKMYSSALRVMRGEYNPYVTLVWLPTRDRPVRDVIDGMEFTGRSIELTGEIKPFTTCIHANDLLIYEKVIEQTAREISEDYTVWQRLHGTSSMV